MDMGLAQILKAEYGDIEVEEADGFARIHFTGRGGCVHRETRNRNARSSARNSNLRRAAKLRDSIKELREKEFLFG